MQWIQCHYRLRVFLVVFDAVFGSAVADVAIFLALRVVTAAVDFFGISVLVLVLRDLVVLLVPVVLLVADAADFAVAFLGAAFGAGAALLAGAFFLGAALAGVFFVGGALVFDLFLGTGSADSELSTLDCSSWLDSSS